MRTFLSTASDASHFLFESSKGERSAWRKTFTLVAVDQAVGVAVPASPTYLAGLSASRHTLMCKCSHYVPWHFLNNGRILADSGKKGLTRDPRPALIIDNSDNDLCAVSTKCSLTGAMQFESLKIFCDVVRWASFSRGAAENGISQSSASQAVHQLELRLGVKLIDRSKRPLVLTTQGKVYYDGCKELVGRYIELENRVKVLEHEHKVVGTVGVASIYSVGMHHMSQYKKTFEERYPEASVRLEYLHPSQVVERVLGGGVDLGLISYPRKWPDLTVIPWREEVMVLAVSPSHRLAARETIDLRELDGEAFVAFDSDLSIRRAIDRCLRHHDVNVEVVLEFDNIENIKRAVEIPAGVSILPEPSLSRELRAGTLVAVQIVGQDPKYQLNRPVAIIHRRHDNLDLTASRFLELLTGADLTGPLSSTSSPARRPIAASPS